MIKNNGLFEQHIGIEALLSDEEGLAQISLQLHQLIVSKFEVTLFLQLLFSISHPDFEVHAQPFDTNSMFVEQRHKFPVRNKLEVINRVSIEILLVNSKRVLTSDRPLLLPLISLVTVLPVHLDLYPSSPSAPSLLART